MAILTTDWQVLSDKQLTGGMFLQIIARYTGQSVGNNCSYVEAQLRIRMGNASNHCYTHSCSFTGGTFNASDSKGSYYHGWEANTTTTILSQSVTIYHDNNGDAAFTIGGTFSNSSGISGSTDSVVCGLPHINRLSVFSIDKPTFNIGETINLSFTKYVNTYRNDLYIVIGNTETFIGSNVGSTFQLDTSYIANSLYAQIPNANSYSNIFKLYTLDGNTILGYTQQNYTAVVTNSNPTFNVAYQDTNQTTIGITQDNQKIIQNKSTLQVNITGASVTNYAGSLTSASVTINNQVTTIPLSGTTNVSANINIGAVNLSQNTNAVVRVTDSRGNYLEKTITILVLPYESPSAIITLKRKLNYYTQTDINVDANYSSLYGNNTINITYRIKKTSDTTWGSYASLQDNVTTTFNADNLYAWDVEVLLQDALETRVLSATLGTGQPPLYVDVMKNSVGVNCFPNRNNTIEVNGIDISNTYSTSEMAIGTWINGDTIYRKVVYVSSLPNATTGAYSVGATISQVVDLRGWAINGLSLTSYRPDNPPGSIGMWYDFGEQKIKIATAIDRSSASAYVIIEYTKSN